MFCPRCGSEYKKGIRNCPDCNVPLVKDLPPEFDESIEFSEAPLISTYNAGDISLVKSVLDSADITYFFKGDHVNPAHTFLEPAHLFVRKDQVEEARELLESLDLTYMSVAPEPDEDDDYDDESEEDLEEEGAAIEDDYNGDFDDYDDDGDRERY